MNATALEEIKDFKRNILASKGDKLNIVADYWNVWIVEDNAGNRFAVNKSKVSHPKTNKNEKITN